MTASKPLGYWLRHLHELLEEHLALVLSERGTSRREWQVLNTLTRGGRPGTDLAPFADPDDPGFTRLLAGLRERGWIDDAGRLTEAGSAAHADLSSRVVEARAAVVGDLTPEQYEETVQRLAAMARNVEAAIAAA